MLFKPEVKPNQNVINNKIASLDLIIWQIHLLILYSL